MFSRPVLLTFLGVALVLEGTQGLDVYQVDETIVPAALTVYSRWYDGDNGGMLSVSYSHDYCEDRGLRLARIQDWTLLDSLQEPHSEDEYWVDALKVPSDIYLRDGNRKISTNGLNYKADDTTVKYGDTVSLLIEDLDIKIVELSEGAGGFLCEVPYILDAPGKDVGYVTCKPYEEWEIVTSNIDLAFDAAVDFCKDQDGEMLSMYTKHDYDWVVTSGSFGPHVYWQNFKNDPFDHTLRWANGYALLPGTHLLHPFNIAPDEVLWNQDNSDNTHHFPAYSALIYNHATTTAGFVDIRSYTARAVCKVHISVKDECESNPCVNGGTCLDLVGDYYCACTDDFTGKNCEMEVNDCAPNPCYNGGSCYPEGTTWKCACPPGYEGDRCQNNIDECATSSCENAGVCFDGENGYTCSCPAKIQGAKCELDTRGCNINSCNYRGTCVELPDPYEYTCVQCDAGYYGDKCELRLKCSSSPCLRGSCYNLREQQDYLCSCPQGWIGKNCEQKECSYLACLNGGSYVIDSVTQVCKCVCTSEYYGNNCQTRIVVVAPNPCENRCPSSTEVCQVIDGTAFCVPLQRPPPPPPPPAPQSSDGTLVIGLSVGGGVLFIIIILVVVYFYCLPATPTNTMVSSTQPAPPYSMYSYRNRTPSGFQSRPMMSIMNSPYGRPNYGYGYP